MKQRERNFTDPAFLEAEYSVRSVRAAERCAGQSLGVAGDCAGTAEFGAHVNRGSQ